MTRGESLKGRNCSRGEHQLIFIEDLKVDGENEAVCGVCEESPSSPGYKCSDCNFLCHKSCFELPEEMQHPLHPNHILSMHYPRGSRYCAACSKRCGKCFFYWCDEKNCNFIIDTKCASRWRVNKEDCHQHTYVPLFKQIQFTCEACGEEGKNIRCLCCTICQLLIHSECASFSCTIKIADHDHLLTLTYSVHQVKEHANILCKLCSKEVNTKYATYYCQKCSYLAHLRCTRWRDLREDTNAIVESASIGYIGHVTGLIKDINRAKNEKDLPQEISHFSHKQHVLILNYEEVKDDKICDGCMQLISPPFYSCAQCKFFLHNVCPNLPIKASHPSFSFPLTLLSQAPFFGGVFKCYFCNQYRHGFAYYFESDTMIEIQCFAIHKTLEHEGHQHPLFFDPISYLTCKFCEEISYLVCSLCNFSLCHRCATLPLIASHKYDEHSLKLTYIAEDKSDEYYCLICEEKRNSNHLFYYYAECNFLAHPQCALGKYPYIKFGKTYKDEHHQHPFTFVRKKEYSPPCDVCGKSFNEVALECTQCKLTVYPKFGDPEKDCLQRLDKYGVK